jgi:hypothetical protein
MVYEAAIVASGHVRKRTSKSGGTVWGVIVDRDRDPVTGNRCRTAHGRKISVRLGASHLEVLDGSMVVAREVGLAASTVQNILNAAGEGQRPSH